MDYTSQLETIEKQVNDKKIEKARLEERLENLKKEQVEIEAKLAEIVPKGENVDEWIKKESDAIEKEIKECQEILAG